MFKSKKIAGSKIRSTGSLSPDHQRLVTLINSMSDAVLAVSAKGKVQLTNGSALSLFDSNNLAGKNLADIMHLVDSKGKKFGTSLLLDNKFTYFNRDLRLRYSDGSLISLELSVSPVRQTFGLSGGGFVILARDITKSKSLEEERDEFISVSSHELRTPIAIAEGNIGNALVLAKKTSASSIVFDSLNAAHDQIIFLGYLINDLSMLSRAEGKNATLEIKTIDVDRLLSSLIDSHESRAADKKLKLSYTKSEESLSFEGNELYVKEILQNFITNSIKYTDRGTIELRAYAQGDNIAFSVKDSGYGISKSEQQKLFSKFFRSQDARIQKSNGTGLGLYVCAKLAKILNGKIEVDSTLDQGSEFRLVLPVVHMPAGSQKG